MVKLEAGFGDRECWQFRLDAFDDLSRRQGRVFFVGQKDGRLRLFEIEIAVDAADIEFLLARVQVVFDRIDRVFDAFQGVLTFEVIGHV